MRGLVRVYFSAGIRHGYLMGVHHLGFMCLVVKM